MTRTFSVSLGSSSLTGKQAIDQTRRFKDQFRSLWKKPDSVTLLTVVSVEPPNMGVVAVYDADDAAASEWVKRAEAMSAELWQKLSERRKGPTR